MDNEVPPPADMPPDAAPPPPGDDSVIFKNEIEIMCRQRLAHLDRGTIKAFSARSARGGANNTHVALVCEPALVPRMRAAPKVAAIINPNFMRLIGAGTVYWPPVKGERYVFIYENNMGMPLMTDKDNSGLGWKPERVIQTVVKPMINVLLDMRDKDLIHGNIRPQNMFISGTPGSERVMLGECLATPPGYLQPALYEPIERAMTDPLARGQGSYDDDLYAFGVSLCVIMRSRNPMEGKSEEDIIREKLELGSYAALTGKDRFTGGILELLRGLLYDDRSQRWTLDEIEAWDQGQRLSPKQAPRKIKASRPVHFNDERYFRPQQLAMDLHKNPTEAVQLVDSDTLGQWVARSLEDKLIAARLEQAIEAAQEQGRGPGYADRLLSRVSAALDPDAPIRYAGMSLHPEGLPCVMAEAFMTKKPLQPFVDIMNQTLVVFWLHNQTDVRLDVGGLVARYDGARAFLRQNNMGYGVERCLYSMCPEVQCVSERLNDYFVLSPEDLMFALEGMAGKPGRPDLFIDRHMAAFLSIKDRRMIDPFLPELNAPDFFKRVLGNVKIVATIQKRSHMESFPGIAGWAADMLDPVYERFHDRELRRKLKEKVAKAKEAGDLSKIVALVDNPDMIQKDMLEFRKAMQEHADLREEHNTREHKMRRPETYGRDTGSEVAAIVSGVLAGILILGFTFLYFTSGGLPF